MARKNITPTFTHEIALRTNAYQNRKLLIKFRALKELYNVLLQELLDNHNQMISNDSFSIARKLYKNEETRQEAKSLFNQLSNEYNVTNSHIEKLATKIKNKTYMKDHLDGDSIQVLAKRVFDAYSRWRFKKGGKPRFKSWKNGVRSISGKKNACISFTKKGKIKWKDLTLDLILDFKDNFGVQAHALNSKIKYCRIIHKIINGKDRFFVQLACEGTPLLKRNHENQSEALGQEVGIDIGVSSVAAVSKNGALLEPFCPNVPNLKKEIKALQRKLSRSSRENNKECFQDDVFVKKGKHYHRKKGKVKKGVRLYQSNNYKKNVFRLKELHRLLAEKRKIEHNQLANKILALGNVLKIEKNSYKAWQKGWFGSTIQAKSPSAFLSTIKRKASKTGGDSYDISAYKAKFSQYCHVCNDYHKKSLRTRIHECNGKPIAQRDLYSATLMLNYDINNSKHLLNSNLFNKVFDDILSAEFNRVVNDKNFRILGLLPQDSCLFEVSEGRKSHTNVNLDLIK